MIFPSLYWVLGLSNSLWWLHSKFYQIEVAVWSCSSGATKFLHVFTLDTWYTVQYASTWVRFWLRLASSYHPFEKLPAGEDTAAKPLLQAHQGIHRQALGTAPVLVQRQGLGRGPKSVQSLVQPAFKLIKNIQPQINLSSMFLLGKTLINHSHSLHSLLCVCWGGTSN